MSKKKNNNYSNNKKNNLNNKQKNNNINNINSEEEVIAPKVELSKDGKKLVETTEFDDTFKKEINNIKHKNDKPKKHIIVNTFSILLLIVSLVYFAINVTDKSIPINTMIINVFITLFTILFVTMSFTYNKKNKSIVFMSSLLLIIFFGLSIYNTRNVNTGSIKANDFRGKSLTYVTKWASKNNIKLNQVYEYNDMVKEYEIIAQDEKLDKDGKLTELTISVSEGPNPSKEIIIPNMISWDSDRVINFIKENYLTNVIVEFVESDKAKNTVIEQNTSGNLKRDDELKLTFSYGEELGFEEVNLIDFTNMSKFEVEFYMKQNQLSYKFSDSFSSKVKKGYVVKQSIEAGKSVKINDETINITISKGPKIKVPDLKNLSMTEVTEWAIKNKLKINFSDKYDDSVKENYVISCNYEVDSIIEQGTVVKVVLSRGALKMPKFKSVNDFYSWADKYEIKYEEKHEFSDSIDAGEVISYSYKAGEAIKNDDTITVTISDGKKREVPNLKGLTKKEAISKLEKAGLNYNFIYKNSVEDKDVVIRQSMSAGSEVSNGATITVTLSNGKAESKKNTDNERVEKREETNNNTSNNENNNNDNNSNSNNNDNNNDDNQDKPEIKVPEKVCNKCTITGLKAIYKNNDGYQDIANALVSEIKGQCPGINVVISGNTTSDKAPGSFISGFSGGDTDSCSTVEITLAK